jgi:hypothetical protein
LVVREPESSGYDANDGMREAIEFDRLADDARVRSKALTPKLATEHHGVGSAGPVLFGKKSAPQKRLDSKQAEEVGRDLHALNSFWLSI